MTEGEASGGWTRNEALLTFSLLFEGKAWGRVSPSQLLELGELVGRSPGSISFKVAGYRALAGGESPRTRRVSSVQRVLYLEYRSRAEDLLRESEKLRADSLRNLPTARIEGASGGFPPAGAIGLAADRCAFPRSACHFFDHGRGRVCGLAVSTGLVLARPREARRFFRECRKIAGRSVRRSEGFRRVESGDLEGFARGVIHWKFPSLHLDELEGPGAMALRQVLVRPEIHRLTVPLEDVRGWTDDDVRIAQDRVRKLIDIDPRTLCSPCLMLVNFVAHQVERKLGSVVSPGAIRRAAT